MSEIIDIQKAMKESIEKADRLFGKTQGEQKEMLEWIFLEGWQNGLIKAWEIYKT